MYMLQLFDTDAADAQPVDARLLGSGSLSIGRDQASDWSIVDEECVLSRTHCELLVEGEGLCVVPLGANGVFDADDRRLADGERCPIDLPATLRLGRFRIVASEAPDLPDAGYETRTMVLSPPLGQSVEVPHEWVDGQADLPRLEGSLFDAFCEGAQIDPSMLASEDPEEIMRRAGTLYRQMVLGIGDLMAERTRARENRALSRTTIGGAGNNLFRWAPSQRLAVDLLREQSAGFLPGPEALRASFRDLKVHLAASFAGFRGSLREAVASFAAERLDRDAAGKSGLLRTRGAARWEELGRVQRDLAEQLEGRRSGSLDKAFAAEYARRERELAQTPAEGPTPGSQG